MTETELTDLRAWSAEVCGYTPITMSFGEPGFQFPSGFGIYAKDWQPDQNIAQAFEVLDAVLATGQLPHFDLHMMSPSRRWSAHVSFGFNTKDAGKPVAGGHASDESCCLAILLACRQAVEISAEVSCQRAVDN